MLNEDPNKHCKKVLDIAAEEADSIPYYFRADEISAKLKKNPSSVQKIIEKLLSSGFIASRTSLNPGAFKTNARIDEILQVAR